MQHPHSRCAFFHRPLEALQHTAGPTASTMNCPGNGKTTPPWAPGPSCPEPCGAAAPCIAGATANSSPAMALSTRGCCCSQALRGGHVEVAHQAVHLLTRARNLVQLLQGANETGERGSGVQNAFCHLACMHLLVAQRRSCWLSHMPLGQPSPPRPCTPSFPPNPLI